MFTNQDLLDLAGQRYFQRGVDYFHQHRATAPVREGNEIHAEVVGTRSYQVTLTLDPELDGYCTCPVSVEGEFCKHCVAVGLAYLAKAKPGEQHGKAISAAHDDENITPQRTPKQSLRKWLSSWSKQALVDALYETITSDPNLHQQWELRLKVEHGGGSPQAVAGLLEQALPELELWDESECDAYYARAESAMAPIVRKIRALPPEPALELALDALQRLNVAIELVPDEWGASYGLLGDLQTLVCEQFARAAELADFDTEKQARWLVKQLLLDSMEFPDIPGEFVFVMGEAGAETAEAFYAECERQLAALPPLPLHAEYPATKRHVLLASPLLSRAKREGDIATQIRLNKRLATEFRDFLVLSELELERGEALESEVWLEKAQKLVRYEHEEEACLAQRIQIGLRSGEQARALKLQWQRLERWTTMDNYSALRSLVQLLDEHGHAVPGESELNQKAEALFVAAAEKRLEKPLAWGRRVEPLVDFYLLHFDYDKAQRWVANHGGSDQQRQAIAQGLLPSEPELAIAHYRHLVFNTLEQANNKAYDRAVRYLIELIGGIRELNGDSIQETAWSLYGALVADVRKLHKRKRNLMRLMDAREL